MVTSLHLIRYYGCGLIGFLEYDGVSLVNCSYSGPWYEVISVDACYGLKTNTGGGKSHRCDGLTNVGLTEAS